MSSDTDKSFLLESEFLCSVRDFISAETQFPISKWFRARAMEVYLRNGPKVIGRSVISCITVSNVEVFSPKQGIYSFFLNYLEAHTDKPIYIENVLMAEHAGIYERRGYKSIADSAGHMHAFYKGFD